MKKKVFIIVFIFLSCLVKAQVHGCTDPLSKNFNPLATVNDGSCEYRQASIAPVKSVHLPDEVIETSGLIKYNNALYTLNDDADINFYALDSISGAVLNTFSLTGTVNNDWEELAQDDTHFYVGDFGNNVKGNRKKLSILKVEKSSLESGNPVIEMIYFNYSGQFDFSSLNNNVTNFDCEAMAVSNDSIYLFTKQWSAKKTSVYRLPKTAGSYTAKFKVNYDVGGLITGATYLEDKKLLVLCGYSSMVKPFLYLLYDFKDHDFFSGNKRKIPLSGMSFNQTEGIATSNGTDYFITNEKLVQQPFVNVSQKLHHLDLSAFLGDYVENIPFREIQNDLKKKIHMYPDGVRAILHIDSDSSMDGARYYIVDNKENEIISGIIKNDMTTVNFHKLPLGIYTVKIDKFPGYCYKLVQK